MRICLVGHRADRLDEGVRSVAAHLAHALQARHEVAFLALQERAAWQRVRAFRPHIIHFVLTPTSAGLLAARLMALAHRSARTVVSAPHPSPDVFRPWPALLRPDLVLAQAPESERRFRACGYATAFLPNGVDIERFAPVDGATKRRLREKYGLGQQFVILHVGPLKAGRNVQLLAQLQGGHRQVLVVGRPSDPGEADVARMLRQQGCIVWTEYIAEIQEVYALSDCYAFPTVERRHCIETPLSVLEALACNLPVVCTPFGALPRVLGEGDGIIYVQSVEAFERAVRGLESRTAPADTRALVRQLSWQAVGRQLEDIYERLLQ